VRHVRTPRPLREGAIVDGTHKFACGSPRPTRLATMRGTRV
jgi:hypothetical protein